MQGTSQDTRYQNYPPPTAPRQPITPAQVRIMSAALEAGLRTDVHNAVKTGCSQRPEPKTSLRNVESGRGVSFETACTAWAALATHATRDAIMRLAQQFYVRLLALRDVEPSCHVSAFDLEIEAQGEADKAQQRFRLAFETGDRTGMQRSIDLTAKHAWCSQLFLEQQLAALAEHDAKVSRTRNVAVFTGRRETW